jgi:hypothetical protein
MQDTTERVEFLLILMEEKRAGLDKLIAVGNHQKEYRDLLLNKKAEYTYFVNVLRAVLDPSKDIY